jgi:hypothetical protein
MLLVLFLSFVAATAANINAAFRLGQPALMLAVDWLFLISDTSSSCPAGTTKLDAGEDFGGGPHLCCPDGFKQQGTGEINGITCCPSGI